MDNQSPASLVLCEITHPFNAKWINVKLSKRLLFPIGCNYLSTLSLIWFHTCYSKDFRWVMNEWVREGVSECEDEGGNESDSESERQKKNTQTHYITSLRDICQNNKFHLFCYSQQVVRPLRNASHPWPFTWLEWRLWLGTYSPLGTVQWSGAIDAQTAIQSRVVSCLL